VDVVLRTVGDKRCPIVDTWWQTETGAHMITPLPGVHALKPGSCTMPLPGIMTAIVDETGHDVEKGQRRHPRHQAPVAFDDPNHLGDRIATRRAITRGIQGQVLLAGDGASRDMDGYYRIMGRIDDVLNVSGTGSERWRSSRRCGEREARCGSGGGRQAG